MPRKTYFLMPNYTYPPDDLVLLGQIITSPTQPATRLAPPLTPTPNVQRDVKRNCGEIISHAQHGEIGIWGAFMSSAFGWGGEAAASFAENHGHQMEFAALETHFFEPDDDFLSKSVDSEKKIREYIGTFPTKSVYMITGLKIARGAKCASFEQKGGGFAARTGGNATPFTSLPVEGGPKFKIGSSGSEENWFGSSSDFVFAYRLSRIVVTFLKGKIKGKNYEKGAETLSLGDGGVVQEHIESLYTDDDLPNGEPNQIDTIYLDKSDFGTNEIPFSITSAEVKDELDNRLCKILVPSGP
jgi:hypothetical protein